MRSFGRLLAVGLVFAAAASLGACASGGTSDGTDEARADQAAPVFDNWAALFRYHVPRAQVRGQCVASVGRGTDSPPAIEVGGQRTYDGCPPGGVEPQDIGRVEMLDSSEAGMLLGSRGHGGLIRMYRR